jgi:hypothetical protein
MPSRTTRAPEAIAFERAYPGTVDQPREVRADLARIAGRSPIIDALELLASDSLNLPNSSFSPFCRAFVSAGWTGCQGLPRGRAGG